MPRTRRRTRRKRSMRGGNLTLYHGSPLALDQLEPRKPRANTPFQSVAGVYLTNDKDTAKIYAIARDPERKNKGWAVKGGKLYLRSDLWPAKYQLNEKGFLYTFRGVEGAVQNPDEIHEYRVERPLEPTTREEVTQADIAHLIVPVTKAEFAAL